MEVTQEQTLHFRSKNAFEYWPSFLHHTYPRMFGLETPGEGVKVAEDATGPIVDPDDRDFMVDPFAAERVCAYVAEWMPGLDPHPVGIDAEHACDHRGELGDRTVHLLDRPIPHHDQSDERDLAGLAIVDRQLVGRHTADRDERGIDLGEPDLHPVDR